MQKTQFEVGEEEAARADARVVFLENQAELKRLLSKGKPIQWANAPDDVEIPTLSIVEDPQSIIIYVDNSYANHGLCAAHTVFWHTLKTLMKELEHDSLLYCVDDCYPSVDRRRP